ncbi:hypothetical protein Dimus_016381 [Dionaea muscipula]
MKRTTAEDGDFRVQVACRRSSRLTPSIPSTCPELVAVEVESSSIDVAGQSSEDEGDGGVLPVMMATAAAEEGHGLRGEEESTMVMSFVPDLSPISEDDRLGGRSSSVFSGSTTPSPDAAVRLCLTAASVGGRDSVSSLFPSSLDASARGREQCPGLGSAMDAVADALRVDVRDEFHGSAECVRFPGVVDGALFADDRAESSGREDGRLAVDLSETLALTNGVGSDALVGDGLVRLSSSCVHLQVDSAVPGSGGISVLHGRVGQPIAPSVEACCALTVDGRDAIFIGGGLVSEEEAVSPEAGAALRPQPTDGLRQPPLSPVEPTLRAGGMSDAATAGSTSSVRVG